MPYIDKITLHGQDYSIGGYSFDGQWVHKDLLICSAKTFTTNTQEVFSLDNYLPKDGHDYEIMLYFIGNTGAAANNAVYYWVRSGANNLFSVRTCGTVTRTASAENSAGMAVIPILHTDRNLAIWLEQNCVSGNCYCGVFAYRRIGTNSWSNPRNISSIVYDNVKYDIDGDMLPGVWTVRRADLLSNVTIQASKAEVITVDLSGHIPNDGYNYECILDGTATTSNTNGQYSSIRFYYPNTESHYPVQETICRSGATQWNYFNLRTPILASNKSIRLINTGSSIVTLNFRIEAYKRIGTNE